MKLSAVHQPTGDVGRLQQRALGRKMGGQIPRDRDKDVSTLVAVPPFAKLLHTCLEDLVGMNLASTRSSACPRVAINAAAG